ncbi:hypothetical protein ABW20_dc0110155 [Dactylellina cionopaga]|nr:hypothetical protein ABW20_dc0110155 [Dactylellina cionopaga]
MEVRDRFPNLETLRVDSSNEHVRYGITNTEFFVRFSRLQRLKYARVPWPIESEHGGDVDPKMLRICVDDMVNGVPGSIEFSNDRMKNLQYIDFVAGFCLPWEAYDCAYESTYKSMCKITCESMYKSMYVSGRDMKICRVRSGEDGWDLRTEENVKKNSLSSTYWT